VDTSQHKLTQTERARLFGRSRPSAPKSLPEPALDPYAIPTSPDAPPRRKSRSRQRAFGGVSQTTLNDLLRIAAWEVVFGGVGDAKQHEKRIRELLAAGASLGEATDPFAPAGESKLLATAKALKGVIDNARGPA
jgi:hypothetical protein